MIVPTSVYGIGAHVRSLIVASSDVTDLVSERVFPGIVPQRTQFPCVVYTQISSERVSVMGEDTGTVMATWQIDHYATTYAVARQLASAVRKALQRQRGTFPDDEDPPIVPRLIQGIFVQADTDLFEDETQLHRVSTDYIVWYQEEGE